MDEYEREIAEIEREIESEVDREIDRKFSGVGDDARESLKARAKAKRLGETHARWQAMREREFHELKRQEAAELRAAWKRRPLVQRIALTTGGGLVGIVRIVGILEAGLLFAAACGVILSVLFGGSGCVSPWFSC